MSSDLTDTAASAAAGSKPKPDIYTAMLIVSLVALLIGIGMLCMELGSFGWDAKGTQIKARIK